MASLIGLLADLLEVAAATTRGVAKALIATDTDFQVSEESVFVAWLLLTGRWKTGVLLAVFAKAARLSAGLN